MNMHVPVMILSGTILFSLSACSKPISSVEIPGLIQEEEQGMVFENNTSSKESTSLNPTTKEETIVSVDKNSVEANNGLKKEDSTTTVISKQQVTKSVESMETSSQAAQPSEQPASSAFGDSSSAKEDKDESESGESPIFEMVGDGYEMGISPIEVPRDPVPEESSDDRTIRLPIAP